MALETVPWFVGGGAEHSPDVARQVAYAATGGGEGVLGAGDFRVTELPVPGTKVRMAAGAAAILNRYLPAPDFGKQSYVARAADVTDIPVTATGSTGGRSDLVVVRIDDPQFGGQTPTDPKVGPYVRFEIVENVPAGTTDASDLGYPAVALARLDIPAQTGTIEQDYIVDLRDRATSRTKREVLMTQPNPSSYDTLTGTSFVDWPAAYEPTVEIPSWATHYALIAHMSGLGHTGGDALGNVRSVVGASSTSAAVGYDTTGAVEGSRENVLVGAAGPVGDMAGTTQTIKLQGNRTSGPGSIRVQPGTTVVFDIEFSEQVV